MFCVQFRFPVRCSLGFSLRVAYGSHTVTYRCTAQIQTINVYLSLTPPLSFPRRGGGTVASAPLPLFHFHT